MLIGHVDKDPGIRVSEAGSKVIAFSFAITEESYTLTNGTWAPERTERHSVVVWRGLADVAEKYVHKGDKLYLEGKIRTRNYDDSRRIKWYIVELFIGNMEILSIKPQLASPSPPLPGHINNQTQSAVSECLPPLPSTKGNLSF